VEGITEWLPVSSTGHMLLLNEFVTLDVSSDFWDMFLVVIQLGAILAVCVLFLEKLNPFSRRKDAPARRATWALWAKVVVACVPAAAVGIPLDDWMEEHLGSPFVIAAALVAYGIAFIAIENAREGKVQRLAKAPAGRPRHLAAEVNAGGMVTERAKSINKSTRSAGISILLTFSIPPEMPRITIKTVIPMKMIR
jgi:undecaprenyl-diphosphatase